MAVLHILDNVLDVECMVRSENLTINVWNQMCLCGPGYMQVMPLSSVIVKKFKNQLDKGLTKATHKML